MTAEQAADLLLILRAAFPDADRGIDDRTAAARRSLYLRVLAKWHPSTAAEAVEACILSCRFYPRVAELREAYEAASRQRPDTRPAQLPATGGTQASPAEVKAACAEALRRFSAGGVASPPKPAAAPIVTPPAPAEDEAAMIAETIRRTGRT